MKKIFITGIAGFLGQNLCRALTEKGYEVSGIDNLAVGKLEWLPDDIQKATYVGDVSEMAESKLYYDIDYIIHLASKKIPRYGGSDKVLLENAKSTSIIVDIALKTKAKLIYLSSSDIYGQQSEFKETSGSVIGTPDIMRWSYAISKMWSEQLLYGTYSSFKDFNFNIIRLFGSYGQYHALSWTAGPQSVFISQALKQEPITIHGDGSQRRCFQYSDDAVDGIVSVMESDCNHEVFNIGNPCEDISINELAKFIWNMVNPDKPFSFKYTPQSTEKYAEVAMRIPDITKAKQMLGFNPKIMLKEGLAKTIEWQRKVMGEIKI
jgi:UDP-glucose 4-epimerase